MRTRSRWWRLLAGLCLVLGGLGARVQAAPSTQTWIPPTNVSGTPTVSSTRPSMGVDVNGTLHLVWVEGTAPATKIMYSARRIGQNWSGAIPIGEQNRSDAPRLVVDNQSRVHVVWQADGNANKS